MLDEVYKVGPAPAAVLLKVLDPEQQGRFRDSFVELAFDLSEILFIATANEWTRIPPPLRDRLEVVELPGYTEAEKVAIARTHLVPAENLAAGLVPTSVRITDGALRKIIRCHLRTLFLAKPARGEHRRPDCFVSALRLGLRPRGA